MSLIEPGLRERVDALRWFHQIDFGGGVVSRGTIALDLLRKLADVFYAGGLKGKTVLDVGCWDGHFSFEAVRRGAARVLATDHFAWSPRCWGQREAFELARAQLAPSTEVMEVDVADLTEARVGRFDVVVFSGVLYHLRHPLMMLEQLAPIVGETLILETHLDARLLRRPAMIFYPGGEASGDATNWWGPNRACVEAMLRDVGFANVKHTRHPGARQRGIFHASR